MATQTFLISRGGAVIELVEAARIERSKENGKLYQENFMEWLAIRETCEILIKEIEKDLTK